jgi:adenylate kinase family enzyme
MLIPKRVKYRKQNRGRMSGVETRGATVDFGEFGLQALEPQWITNPQIERLSARRICEKCQTPYNMVSKPPKNDKICDICQGRVIQRPDDRPEVIMNRLNTYEQQTKPLVDYYRSQGILKIVVSKGSIDDVFQQVQKVLGTISV